MREIKLLGSRIFVWPGVHAEAGENIRVLAPDAKKAFILTDTHCRPYARRVELGLRQSRIDTKLAAVPAGERQKSLATVAKMYRRLAAWKLDRRSVIVAVGGGVITDLGGFLAATWMRGVPVFHVPTTLTGQVDAAIGGKTGVNLKEGKNLVGSFHQPAAVFCDPIALKTLPRREFVGGLAEVVKYGMIRDARLMSILERKVDRMLDREISVIEEVVARCAAIKARVVSGDEREKGDRAILNYGHTVGHALEAAAGYGKLHHGEAVAIGMEVEGRIARELGMVPQKALAVQTRTLKLCGLPTRLERFSLSKINAAMALDKKGVGGKLRFVLPRAVGRVKWPVEVASKTVTAALQALMA